MKFNNYKDESKIYYEIYIDIVGSSDFGGWCTIWRFLVFANSLDGTSVILIKMVGIGYFKSPNADGKMQFLIETTTVMVFIQKFDYSIAIIFGNINSNINLQPRTPPPLHCES